MSRGAIASIAPNKNAGGNLHTTRKILWASATPMIRNRYYDFHDTTTNPIRITNFRSDSKPSPTTTTAPLITPDGPRIKMATTNSEIENGVNLKILPFCAMFVFIALVFLKISQWCMEDLRDSDRFISSAYKSYHNIGAFSRYHRQTSHMSGGPELDCDEDGHSPTVGGSQLNLFRLQQRIKIRQQAKLMHARSTRSLNSVSMGRVGGGGDRTFASRALTRCKNHYVSSASCSESSIVLSSTPALNQKTVHHDSAARSNHLHQSAIGGLLMQSRAIVIPIATPGALYRQAPSKSRTRHPSSNASSTKSGASCRSDVRHLLGSSPLSADARMTSSDSNINTATTPPHKSKKRTRNGRGKPQRAVCVNSVGNLAARSTAGLSAAALVLHREHGAPSNRTPSSGGAKVAVLNLRACSQHNQSTVPAVSKLVSESLNLSFRCFRQVVPVCSNSNSFSCKESCDSVFADQGSELPVSPSVYSAASTGVDCAKRTSHHPATADDGTNVENHDTSFEIDDEKRFSSLVSPDVMDRGMDSVTSCRESDVLQSNDIFPDEFLACGETLAIRTRNNRSKSIFSPLFRSGDFPACSDLRRSMSANEVLGVCCH